MLSGIFTHAKNEGAFDGANPVQGALIPGHAREPGETYAYNLAQILRILEVLPLLPKQSSLPHPSPGCARANCAGWSGRTIGEQLSVNRSAWRGCQQAQDPREPSVRSGDPKLATILDAYRASMHNPTAGVCSTLATGKGWTWTSWPSG